MADSEGARVGFCVFPDLGWSQSFFFISRSKVGARNL